MVGNRACNGRPAARTQSKKGAEAAI